MPFNDSVERPSVKKKPSSTNKVSNLVKITALGILGFGSVIMNSLLPITGGEDPQRDTIFVLAGLETEENCTETGCIQSIVGVTESMDLYNLSGSLVIGSPANPICELSSTGALQGSSCTITAGVTIIGTLSQSSGDERYVQKQGGTMSGALVIDMTGGNDNTVGLEVINTMSGTIVHANKTLTSSGGLVIEGTASGKILHITQAASFMWIPNCNFLVTGSAGALSCGTLPTRTIVLTAGGGLPSQLTGSGASGPEKFTLSTNDTSAYVLEFGNFAKPRYAMWTATMPDNYDGSTMTFKFNWTTAATSGDVKWYIQCRSIGDNEAIDQSWGTAVGIADTADTANSVRTTSATAAVTCAGTPAGGEIVQFRVYRDAADAADSLANTGTLISVKGEYVTNSLTD